MHSSDLDFLNSSFAREWHGIGAAPSGTLLCNALIGAYSEPHRRYHSLQHLVECLHYFDSAFHLAFRPYEIEMALWFHDAVYDVKRSDNEQLSADWAKRELESANVNNDVIDRIVRLVLVTQHTGVPSEADQKLLVDIDLSVLGATTDRFSEYERQIREEYAFVPGILFRSKRRSILQSFAARARLYETDHFCNLLENRARSNLHRVLATL